MLFGERPQRKPYGPLAGLIQTGLAQDQTLKQVMQPILAAVAS